MLPAGLVVLAGLLSLAAMPWDRHEPGPPPWRVTGKLGFTADAVAFPDSAGTSLEIYVRIPPTTLAGIVEDSLGTSRLRLSARLKSAYGAPVHDAVQEFTIEPGDTVGGFGKVVLLRFPARPGKLRLQVRLEDLQSQRRGIAYLGRKVREAGTVEGVMAIPAAAPARLSDLEFVWSEAPSRGGAVFRHDGETVLPDPERLYGLFQSELIARLVATGAPGDERAWHWRAQVLDSAQAVVASRESTLAATPRLDFSPRFDITREPAGGYDLEVRAWREGDSAPMTRRAHFSIAWRREAWLMNPLDLQDLVHFLLDPDQEESFVSLEPGEQERLLDEFWRRRDPSPETAVNEAYETFLRRVDHANRTFSRAGVGKGMFSDMGRVYIRYGEPSEVYRQVMPTGSETLEDIVLQLSRTETRSVGDVTDKQLGSDLRPFELWSYDPGTAPPPDTDPTVAERRRQRRIVFLFVDEHGLGDFRLVYSTE